MLVSQVEEVASDIGSSLRKGVDKIFIPAI